MVSPDPWRWTLREVVEALRERRLGAGELLDSVLGRCAGAEPDVHAFVTITEERARGEAVHAQDTLAAQGAQAPPLTGVPIAVKDLMDVSGVPTTASSKVLADNVPAADADAWSALRSQGAVMLGKANTHEFAYGGATAPTRNPWDLDRIAGGSSGGSAAALAAGMCHGALGSDTAGSIRIPAALCGVSGLKPTRSLISTKGVVPLSPSLDVVGPMARTPDDVYCLLQALRGSPELAPLSRESVHGLRIGVVEPQGPVDAGVLKALESAAATLSEAGATVQPVDLRMDLAHAAAVNFTIMGAEAAAFHRDWLTSRPEEYSEDVRTRLLAAGHITQQEYSEAMAARAPVARQLEVALQDLDLLLLNGVPCTASPAYDADVLVNGQASDRDTLLCRDMAFANLSGNPVLQVPAGVSDGLPVGVQLVGRIGDDDSLFAPGQLVFDQLAAGTPV